jgi:hypothetical protein
MKEQFLTNRDDTGRFIVYSPRTGISYYVEPLDGDRTPSWGDMDPATKELTGAYGVKYKGSIHPGESLITEDNGFKNIVVLAPGTSPYSEIECTDKLRYEQGFRPKQNLPW